MATFTPQCSGQDTRNSARVFCSGGSDALILRSYKGTVERLYAIMDETENKNEIWAVYMKKP